MRSGSGHAPRLVEQSLRRPPLPAAGSAVRGPPRRGLLAGLRLRARPVGGSRGGVPAAVTKADWRGGSGMSVGAATLDARRALLADLPSYGARRVPFARAPGGLPRPAPSS